MISCGHVLFPQSVSPWKMGPYLVLARNVGRGRTGSAQSGFDGSADGCTWCGPYSRVPFGEKSPGPVSLTTRAWWEAPLSSEGRTSRRKGCWILAFTVGGGVHGCWGEVVRAEEGYAR